MFKTNYGSGQAQVEYVFTRIKLANIYLERKYIDLADIDGGVRPSGHKGGA